MKEIFGTDIKDKKEFKFGGDTLKMAECVDEEQHIYIFNRYNHCGHLIAYEVVKGVRCKQPDGSIVYTYPSSELFGSKGYFISSKYKDTIPSYIEKLKNTPIKG